MTRIYDNWESLVRATLRREDLRHTGQRTPSDLSSPFSSSSISSSPRASTFNLTKLSSGLKSSSLLYPTHSSEVKDCIEKRLPNGDLYIGTLSENVPHGSGKYLWKDGCMYEGDWKRGKASGKGKFSWPSGATFEGEFKSGRFEGMGTFIGPDGDMYKGHWSADRKHGYGKKHYSNGDYYEGYWKRNSQDGRGRYVWRNGNDYVGDWKNGMINGRGILYWANGNRFDGTLEGGVPTGRGVFTWSDGSCYIGCWAKDSENKGSEILNGTFHPAGCNDINNIAMQLFRIDRFLTSQD